MIKEIKTIEYYIKFREICGLSQSELAKLCGMTRQSINLYEKRKTNTPKYILLLLDYVLNEYYNTNKDIIKNNVEVFNDVLKSLN